MEKVEKRPEFEPPAVIDEQTEDEYVIDRLGGLLAEIAVALKGEQPAGTLWSYHDLPDMVRKLAAERTSQPPCALPDAVLNVAELLHTQDNRCTNAPIFIVERKRRVYGIDPDWGGEVVWLHDGSEIADPDEIKKLEAGHENGDDDPDNHIRTSYADHWEFVTACFTEEGCKSFIRRDGHNHGETRIYAAGSYRNNEWSAIRDYLKAQRATSTKCAACGATTAEDCYFSQDKPANCAFKTKGNSHE